MTAGLFILLKAHDKCTAGYVNFKYVRKQSSKRNPNQLHVATSSPTTSVTAKHQNPTTLISRLQVFLLLLLLLFLFPILFLLLLLFFLGLLLGRFLLFFLPFLFVELVPHFLFCLGLLFERGFGESLRFFDTVGHNDVVKEGAGLNLPQLEADCSARIATMVNGVVLLESWVRNHGMNPLTLVGGIVNLLLRPLSLVLGVANLWRLPLTILLNIPVFGLLSLWVRDQLRNVIVACWFLVL